uniref:Uncharacterized protein n=1 Tax=Rhizophora mucronata TaxID=61149 RepID=A0A2P2QJF8_RHIMU
MQLSRKKPFKLVEQNLVHFRKVYSRDL